ncbi:hypothetical protein TcBrA4_0076270 [Trypanosoma cruzi]|nr:hypothetical protein TcBrA4_0076270 [Trypanosoma cruzi]
MRGERPRGEAQGGAYSAVPRSMWQAKKLHGAVGVTTATFGERCIEDDGRSWVRRAASAVSRAHDKTNVELAGLRLQVIRQYLERPPACYKDAAGSGDNKKEKPPGGDAAINSPQSTAHSAWSCIETL